MCGIFFYSKGEIKIDDQFVLKNLRHRGPDFKKVIHFEESVIGHTLLSIREEIDLSIQPVVSRNSRYIISFNGQIYNVQELIKKFGLKKDIKLDTKIILELFEILGLDAIKELKGMFAILVYDKLKKIIYAFRDNSGQKPLYYFYDNKQIFFCSEINPIFEVLRGKISLNSKILDGLRFLSNLGENTIFDKIYKLLPGERVQYNLETKKIDKSFFKSNFTLTNNLSLNELLNYTIKDHLQTNRKMILNLSGGVDSNIILHESLKSNNNLSVMSTRYETNDQRYNRDFYLAQEISKNYGVNFYENFISKETYINNFVESFEKIEDLNANTNNPSYYTTYKHINNLGYRSVLSGDGGDEIFIGYDWYYLNRQKFINKFFGLGKFLINQNNFLKTFYFFRNFNRYNSILNFQNFFKNNKNNLDFIYKMSKLFKKFKGNNFSVISNDLSFQNLIQTQFFWLSEETFNRADKLSMANSIEVRAPFSDYNLRVNILNRLTKKNFEAENNKSIIVDYYKAKLNKKIFEKKTGWTSPRDWILDPKIKSILLDIFPEKDSQGILWSKIKKELVNNNDLILNRSFNSIISLGILLRKYNL